MFDAEEYEKLKEMIHSCTQSDRHVLDQLCREIRPLRAEVGTIKGRSATAVSLVASDGGNQGLSFDPFFVQLVRVVDSYGKNMFLDAVTPTSSIDYLERAQFNGDGSPRSPVGRLMRDLGIRGTSLNAISPMIPSSRFARENPDKMSPSWVQVYRDLCEWAVLYERICHGSFATDTLIVRDGLLRSKIFQQDYFIKMMDLVEAGIQRLYREDRRKIFLVGIAKRSKDLERYNLALQIEEIFPAGDSVFVRIPRELEAKAYTWPEYARGAEEEREGEKAKFVMGIMHFVRFGSRNGDPIWTVDMLPSQMERRAEVFGYLLSDAVEGFPVPFYPRCLQKAHEFARIADFDLKILQDQVTQAVRELLPLEKRAIIDGLILQSDMGGGRYS